jgi:hypothetical protein
MIASHCHLDFPELAADVDGIQAGAAMRLRSLGWTESPPAICPYFPHHEAPALTKYDRMTQIDAPDVLDEARRQTS